MVRAGLSKSLCRGFESHRAFQNIMENDKDKLDALSKLQELQTTSNLEERVTFLEGEIAEIKKQQANISQRLVNEINRSIRQDNSLAKTIGNALIYSNTTSGKKEK